MDLFSADAEACNLAGNLEDSNMYCDKILEQESFSVLENPVQIKSGVGGSLLQWKLKKLDYFN